VKTKRLCQPFYYFVVVFKEPVGVRGNTI